MVSNLEQKSQSRAEGRDENRGAFSEEDAAAKTLQEEQQHQRLESIGQFAANVAHDFNNILTIIQGYTSLLLSQRELPPEMSEPLHQISTASERATNLTRQLMIFSRKNVVEPQLLNLNDLIRSFASLLRRGLGDQIEPQFSFDPNLPLVHVDPGMMEQLLMNLALNARDAMPEGGQFRLDTFLVEISVEEARRNLEARAGNFICLRVTDNGAGMNADTMAKIFEPFFTTKKTGPGLGLSAVYGIVQQHGGWIEVSSRLGQGTVFKVFVPAAPPARVEAPPPEAAPSGGSETILVVEDEPAVRFLSARQLRKLGYRILEASSGAEALSIWRQHAGEIDLLFTDIVMPDGMTGSELAETLLAEKPGLKIIYASGYSLDVVEQEFSLRKGASFLHKPYSAAAVSNLIRTLLDGRPRQAVA
jgi:nitrogen-specific signal transduction histidine kinase/ActR/RegA family two-component response regulator